MQPKTVSLILVDSYSLVFRTFYSGATSLEWFWTNLKNLLKKLPSGRVVLVGDAGGKNWRHDLLPEYKSNRHSTPSELVTQLNELPIQACELNFEWIACKGWEADDILYTLVLQAEREGYEAVVVTGDKDLFQLMQYPHVRVWNGIKNEFVTLEYVKKKFGVTPHLIGDFLALAGDASDAIPGVPKIGPKTAASLLNRYGSMESLLVHLDELPEDCRTKSLKANIHLARLSKELVTLKQAPVSLQFHGSEVAPEERSWDEVEEEMLQTGWIVVHNSQAASASKWCRVDERIVYPEHICRLGADSRASNSIDVLHNVLYGVAAPPAEYAWQLALLWKKMQEDIRSFRCSRAYYWCDRSVVGVLRAMERRGACVDLGLLGSLEKRLNAEVQQIQSSIYNLVGKEFLISSPQQLSAVLQEMGLITGKKTNASTLEGIEHPIIEQLLSYRYLKKLLSTYVIPLQKLADSECRVHTSYTLTVTKTGRLSSLQPNLQNIPVKGDLGNELRNVFQASAGKVLVAADYDQVELRLLAHMGPIPELIAKLNSGEDWHSHVSRMLFDSDSADCRRRAKTVTFGLMYGMSPNGLAKRLRISAEEAYRIYDMYYSMFPGMKEYQERTINHARKNGFVVTMWGRRCYVAGADMHRQAINAPIQGSAADIIKRAMVMLGDESLILQVHDELIAEVAEDAAMDTARRMKQCMEVHALAVPLTVKVYCGKRWGSLELVQT